MLCHALGCRLRAELAAELFVLLLVPVFVAQNWVIPRNFLRKPYLLLPSARFLTLRLRAPNLLLDDVLTLPLVQLVALLSQLGVDLVDDAHRVQHVNLGGP